MISVARVSGLVVVDIGGC